MADWLCWVYGDGAERQILNVERWKNTSVIAILTILLFFLMRPGIVAWLEPGIVQAVFNGARWAAVTISVVLYLFVVRFDLFGLAIVSLGMCSFCSLYFNGVNLYFFDEFWAPACASALLARSAGKLFRYELVWAMLIVSSLISVLNLASILIFPEGLFGVGRYLNGHKNLSIFAILPSVVTSMLLDDRRGKGFSLRTICLYCIGLAQVVIAQSSTSLVALALLLLGAILLQKRNIRRILNAYAYISAYTIAFLGIIVLRLQSMFGFFIEGMLGKSLDFTGRTAIWAEAIQNVVTTNLLIGCGEDWFENVGGSVVGTAHNMILETFVQGGILGVVSLIIAILLSAFPLFESRSSRSSAYLALALGCFLIIGLMEHLRWPAFFFFLGLSMSWGSLAGAHLPHQHLGHSPRFF